MVVYVDAPGDELGSLWISSNVEGLLGYPLELWQRDRGLFSSVLHPDDLVRLRREQREAAVGAEHTTEYRLIAADGRTVWIRDRYTISADADGRPLMVQGVREDVTALRAAENRLREVLDDINLLAVTLDRGGRVVFANDHFLATMGRRRDEVVGQDWFGLFAPMEERDLRRQSYAHAMETGMIPRHGELRLLTADGGVRLIRYNHTLVMGDDGKPAQLTSIAEDITDRRRAEDEVHRLAHYDPLTGLPNRTMFSKDLDEAIRCSVRLGRTVGVMFVSLDDFTLVNDSLGPAAGNALLRQFTARLEEAASSRPPSPGRAATSSWCCWPTATHPRTRRRTSSPRTSPRWRARSTTACSGCSESPSATTAPTSTCQPRSGWRCARATPPRATPC